LYCDCHGLLGAIPKIMSATLNVVVSINSTTVMQTYWTAPFFYPSQTKQQKNIFVCATSMPHFENLFAIPASPR
ncbi:MAG: hypothetical protein IIW99_08720, partial [Treponema sp.]|nr:hypothetical protein [Treponema sp.]